jgi:hypothetical protein
MLCAMRTYGHTGGNLLFPHGFSIRSVNIPLRATLNAPAIFLSIGYVIVSLLFVLRVVGSTLGSAVT